MNTKLNLSCRADFDLINNFDYNFKINNYFCIVENMKCMHVGLVIFLPNEPGLAGCCLELLVQNFCVDGCASRSQLGD